MKKPSANGIIVCAGLLMTGITSAINAGTAQPGQMSEKQGYQSYNYTASGTTDRKTALLFQQLMKNNKGMEVQVNVAKKPVSRQNYQNFSYTANGTTDKKTALLFKQLMKNNKNLQVHAEVVSNPAPKQNYQNFSYTASGKTDRKTALLFKQLMKNNKGLEVHAEVSKRPSPTRNRQVEVAVNYTVHGKTSMKNLRKLINLFQNSKEIQVSATANVRRSNTAKRIPKQENPQPQRKQNLYNNADSAFVFNSNPSSYYPTFYYPGYPPAYIQGNTMWIPVPVTAEPIATQETPQYPALSADNAPFPMDYSANYSKSIASR